MENEDQDQSGASFVENAGWLALGALVGVSLAMLLAPERGVHTRRRIAKHVKSGGQNLFDSSQDVITRGRELFEKGREIAQEAADMFERGRRMAEAGFDEKVESERGF